MLDLAISVGVVDDPALARAQERFVAAGERRDRAQALLLGAFFALILFVAILGWNA